MICLNKIVCVVLVSTRHYTRTKSTLYTWLLLCLCQKSVSLCVVHPVLKEKHGKTLSLGKKNKVKKNIQNGRKEEEKEYFS